MVKSKVAGKAQAKQTRSKRKIQLDITALSDDELCDIMPIRDVARACGRTIRTIHNRVYAGLEPRPLGKIGGRLMWRRADVTRWIRDELRGEALTDG